MMNCCRLRLPAEDIDYSPPKRLLPQYSLPPAADDASQRSTFGHRRLHEVDYEGDEFSYISRHIDARVYSRCRDDASPCLKFYGHLRTKFYFPQPDDRAR